MFDKNLLLQHVANRSKTIEDQLNEQLGGVIPRIAPSMRDRKVAGFGSNERAKPERPGEPALPPRAVDPEFRPGSAYDKFMQSIYDGTQNKKREARDRARNRPEVSPSVLKRIKDEEYKKSPKYRGPLQPTRERTREEVERDQVTKSTPRRPGNKSGGVQAGNIPGSPGVMGPPNPPSTEETPSTQKPLWQRQKEYNDKMNTVRDKDGNVTGRSTLKYYNLPGFMRKPGDPGYSDLKPLQRPDSGGTVGDLLDRDPGARLGSMPSYRTQDKKREGTPERQGRTPRPAPNPSGKIDGSRMTLKSIADRNRGRPVTSGY